jgi:hypothetical protein
MALRANFKTDTHSVTDAYIKIVEIWGNKGGWNARVGVFSNEADQVPATVFIVSTEYDESVNPFVSVYKKIESISALTDVRHSDGQSAPALPVVEVSEVQEEPKKKAAKPKKAKAAE